MNKLIKSENKLILFGVAFLALFASLYFGVTPNIAKATSATGTIDINLDSNGGADPDCWPADTACSVWWGDGADRGVDLNTCAHKAVRYATGLSDISNLNISYQTTAKIVACNGFDKGDTSYQTYKVSYSPKAPLTVSCTANPSSINTGQSVTFTSNVSGDSGSNYTYLWSGACTGTGATCNTTLNTQGTQTSSVTVTSGTQIISTSCSVAVSQNNNNTCAQNSYQRCSGSNLYWYDSCGNQENLIQYCANGCYNNSCQNYTNTCTYHAYERCTGNNLYWYDSCGTQQDLAQYCQNGCYNNSCQNYNNYNPYGNCTYHAYKLCQGNSLYWYDSCGTQQDIYYTCVSGQICNNSGLYGQCVAYIQPVQPINNYVAHYKTACYGGSLYWYDSLGATSGLYKNCADNNSCTIDACSGDKCSNIIKCDGSTCAIGTVDYSNFCGPVNQNQCGNGLCEPNLGETTTSCPNDCKISASANGLSISLFAKQDLNSAQWQKTADVGSNSQIYFMISATNNSTAQIDNVNISANIPMEISSLGNLQLNGVPVAGDIVSGINIGSVAPASPKSITFEGKTQVISGPATKQATVTSNVSGTTQTDSVSITLSPAQAAATVSNTPVASGFTEFLKRWYLWILGAVVLVFLFIIVFKRLSSNV